MDIDPREISLMNAGACGAFVHGLEDEFMGKRSMGEVHYAICFTYHSQLRKTGRAAFRGVGG